MRTMLLHSLFAVFLALITGTVLPIFAQEHSGVYATQLGAQTLGTESYRITKVAEGGYRAEADATFMGSKIKAVTLIGNDGGPVSFTMELNGATVMKQEYTTEGTRVEAAGQPARTIGTRPDVVLENGLWHQFHFLLARYDSARGGAQEFAALLPSQALAFKVTLEHVGTPSFDVKGRRVSTVHYTARTSLGLSFELWADEAGTPLLVSVPAQSVRAVRGGSEELAVAAFPAKAGPSERDPYTSVEVAFANGAQKLAGTLTVPKSGSAPHPAAILISGSGAQDRDGTGVADIYRRIAETLSSNGVAVLRVDDRGAGKSAMPSGPASYLDLVGDTRAALEFLLTRAEIDKSRIVLVGHSEGALTALVIAAEDRRVAAIALLAGASQPLDKVLYEQSLYQAAIAGPVEPSDRTKFSALGRQLMELFEKIAAQPKPAAGVADAHAWFREHMTFDPLALARKVSVPALVMVGERDALVLPHHALALSRAMSDAGNKRVTLRVLSNLTHVFTPAYNSDETKGERAGEVSPEFLKALNDWATVTLMKK